MGLTNIVPSSKFYFPTPPHRPNKTQIPPSSSPVSDISERTKSPHPKTRLKPLNKSSKNNPPISPNNTKAEPTTIKPPTMSDIMESSKSQNIDLQLQTIGPFFRITAKSLETKAELGRAEGLIRVWWKGKILHLDSIRMRRESMGMERSIFGIGLFIGAVAIRYGYDCGCSTAELLAINDSPLYHSKLVRFYTRIGFKAVHEVTGSSIGDMGHMLAWGGVGTRMDGDVKELLLKWCTRFTPPVCVNKRCSE